MDIVAANGLPPTPPPADRATLRKAAEGFEEMFLVQLMKTARSAELAPDIMGGDGVERMRDLFDAEIAKSSAGRTGLGIADAVEAQFAAFLTQEP
jgi:peptidoglycan hydrolase FlgJ